MRFLFLLTYSTLLLSCREEIFPGSGEESSNGPPISETAACAMTITSPGEYTLNENLESDACAIEIKSSNVKLDLNGYTLKGPHDMQAISFGIKSLDKSNIEIFNGKIEGFLHGVSIIGSSGRGDDISNNYIHHLEVTYSSQKGIEASGYNVKVTNNTVRQTGKTKAFKRAYGYGIEVTGPSCVVSNNTVTDTYGGTDLAEDMIAEGIAISFSYFSTYCVAENNHIENSIMVSDKSTFGFWVDVYSYVTLKNNYIRNMHYSGVVPPFTGLDTNDLDKAIIHIVSDR